MNVCHIGDCRQVMRRLIAEGVRVQMCVTSPPYWGLRDYGVPGQLGLESTPAEYVANMVEVFALVRELLADDGTLWLNLGDTYNNFRVSMNGQSVHDGEQRDKPPGRRAVDYALKEKDLCGIPWRVAFALQADGWYLRQDIIWAKPNPMPESVQGSHYSRHLVTIADYERLSGLRYVCECAGDAWAGDMPPLSESAISHRKAPLSAEHKGHRDCSCKGRARGRSGEAAPVQPVSLWASEPGKVREDGERATHTREGDPQVSRESTIEGSECSPASTDQGSRGAQTTAEESELQLPAHGERKGAFQATTCEAKGRDSLDGEPPDCGGLVGDHRVPPASVLLLQEADKANDGPCDSTEQGWAAHEDERGSGLPTLQFSQTRSVDPARLVGCPGCPKCIEHHGYTFHLSAGRCTKAHEYLFLLAKRERYYYDAQAIAEDNITEGLASGGLGRSWHDHKDDLIQGDRKDPEFNGKHSAFPGKRNRRSVWTVPTAPYADAHFATFPPALIEPCIMAGSRVGDVVLDPFMGSGTVGQVAQDLGRQWLGIELNEAYVKLQERRTAQSAMVFT